MTNLVPGLGLARGMLLTLQRFFAPKATIRYPEQPADNSPKFRGRLQLLYDEYGTLKCETCFQCAQACPIECIDMGGIDTKSRYHVHWGPPETYGERRDESALRRSGRPVPDQAYEHFGPIDLTAVDEAMAEHDYDPKHLLAMLEATQRAYGYLPVAAIKHISNMTGAWYAMIYGTATYYGHLRFEKPADREQTDARLEARPSESTYRNELATALAGGGTSGRRTRRGGAAPAAGKPAKPTRKAVRPQQDRPSSKDTSTAGTSTEPANPTERRPRGPRSH